MELPMFGSFGGSSWGASKETSSFEDEEVPFDLATRTVDLDQHLSRVCSVHLPSYDRPLEQPSKLISY